MFQIGKKVVCIDDSPFNKSGCCPTVPSLHEILTVVDIDTDISALEFDKYNRCPKGHLHYWGMKCFRPLEDFPDFAHLGEAQEHQESIEILTPQTV